MSSKLSKTSKTSRNKRTTRLASLAFAAVAMTTAMASTALADTDLDATVEDIVCPTDVDPGSIRVLGVTSVLPVGVEIRGAACADIQDGDRVKVKCADPACATAAKVEWKAKVSAEGPVASADCSDRVEFTLASGVTCAVDASTPVRAKKPDKHHSSKHGPKPDPKPTMTTVFDLFCAPETVLGTTPGTQEVKCEGMDRGEGVIDASKVEIKK